MTMPTDPEFDAILNAAREANDAAQAEWWREEAARQDEIGRELAAAGRQCPMPSREEAEKLYPPDAPAQREET